MQHPPILDRFDRAILALVQRNNKMPQRSIAEQVGLSAAAVQRRIAKMEAKGIILRNCAIANPQALGMAITAIVEVQLKDERQETVDQAKALFRTAQEVQHCYYVTGGISFTLIIVAKDMTNYESITRRLFASNAHIASYRSLIALDRVKSDSFIPVE